MIRDLVRLMRPKHYIKNGLILLPLMFGSQLLQGGQLLAIVAALVTFSLTASIVYIVNDIRDAAKDKLHPQKKFRPIASGKVTTGQAIALIGVLAVITVVVGFATGLNTTSWLLLVSYVVINIAYSFGLKHLPIVDVALLASGFVIRVLFGASMFAIALSPWLYLTILAGAFYMSFGKRRNEIIINGTRSRKVNERYSLQFLDKNMYVCLALTLVFYSLWATDPVRANILLYITIPFFMVTLMTYSLKIEQDNSTGDPVDVLSKSRALQLLVPTFIIALAFAVYA